MALHGFSENSPSSSEGGRESLNADSGKFKKGRKELSGILVAKEAVYYKKKGKIYRKIVDTNSATPASKIQQDKVKNQASEPPKMYPPEGRFEAKLIVTSAKIWAKDDEEKELGVLHKGDFVVVSGELYNSYYVKTANGIEGYVFKAFIQKKERKVAKIVPKENVITQGQNSELPHPKKKEPSSLQQDAPPNIHIHPGADVDDESSQNDGSESHQPPAQNYDNLPLTSLTSLAPLTSGQENVNKTPEFHETVAWNKEIVLTFDDSPLDAPMVIDYLESKNVQNYRFYAASGMAIKDDVLLEMGCPKGLNGLPDTTRVKPGIEHGMWLRDYVDKKRGSMSRKEFIRSAMLKNNYLEAGKKIKKYYQTTYPNSWQEKIQEHFGYHAGVIHPDYPMYLSDKTEHIQFWTKEQIKGDILFFREFMDAWLDIDGYKVKRLRTPIGGGFGFDKKIEDCGNSKKLVSAAKEVDPDAQWDMWASDSWDASTKGGEHPLPGRTMEKSVNEVFAYKKGKGFLSDRKYAPKEALMLFHTKYYGTSTGIARLEKFIDEIDKTYKNDQTESGTVKNELTMYSPDLVFTGDLNSASSKLWGLNGKEVATLKRGDTFMVIGEKKDGYFIETSNGLKGLIAKSFVESKQSLADKYRLSKAIQGKPIIYEFGEWTPDKLENLIKSMAGLPQEQKMMKLYKAWENISYKKRIRGISGGYENLKIVEEHPNSLVIRLDALDCTEFPVYALAIMGANNYSDFVNRLVKIKYKDGVIDDKYKLHYTYSLRFQEWKKQGLATNFTDELNKDHPELTATDSRSSTTIADIQLTEKQKYNYIPFNKMTEAGQYLKTGDIFGFVLSDAKNRSFGHDKKTGNKREQIIGHMGFIYKENGEVYFMHANASKYHDGTQAGISIGEKWDAVNKKLLKGTKRTLKSYLLENSEEFKGIVVMRPKYEN